MRDSLEAEKKKELLLIIDKVYKDKQPIELQSYKNFNLIFSKKILVRDQKYHNEKYSKREMTVFNLHRQEAEIINSLLILLSKHIDYCNRGMTTNGKEFQAIYKTLLFYSLDNGYLDYNELKSSVDYQNIKVIHTTLDNYWNNTLDDQEIAILEIYKSFEIKEALKKNGFYYNRIYNCWEKEVEKSKVTTTINYLRKMNENILFKTRNKNKIIFSVIANIYASGDTYRFKDIFKSLGFQFRNDRWTKKIRSSSYHKVKKELESKLPNAQGILIGIDFD